ncbi:MAG: helix-turn-helix domain-containing protein, partial [Pseudonocardiaceae bacterium]
MAEVSELLSTRAGRVALLDRDIPRVYRLLVDAGISQHQIARWTRQRQSEVHDILKGRQVRNVDVLERICDGLGVPRGWMRLAYAEDVASNTAPDDVGQTPQEVADAMKRRTVV